MRILKILFLSGVVLAALIFIGVSILSVSGGSNDNLRRGLEQFLTDYTGLVATIGTLEDAQFYPDLIMDARDVALRDTANDPMPDVKIGEIRVRMRFWDAILSRGAFREFTITSLATEPAAIFPVVLSFEKVSVETSEGRAGLTGKGSYDGRPLTFFLPLEVTGDRGGSVHAPEKGGVPVFFFAAPEDAATIAQTLRARLIPPGAPAPALAGLSARVAVLSGPGIVGEGPFAGKIRCAAALANMKGASAMLDPVWALRESAEMSGTGHYDLASGAFSVKEERPSDPAALAPFSGTFRDANLAECAAALESWSRRATP